MVDAEQVANLLESMGGPYGMMPNSELYVVLSSWGSPPPEDPEGDVRRAVEAGTIMEDDGVYYMPGSEYDRSRRESNGM